MNEKYESNKENDEIDSLITNIDKVQDDSHINSLSSKSSKSCKSSSSSFSSFKDGKTDPEEIEEQKQNCRDNLCNDNYCFLIKMIWFYGIFNFHRLLILIFRCDKCKKILNILMEKSQSGKEICVFSDPEFCNVWYIIKWDYSPKSKISYYFCEQCFDEASGDWSLITNNCGHFAKYIWEKIKKKDKNNYIKDIDKRLNSSRI